MIKLSEKNYNKTIVRLKHRFITLNLLEKHGEKYIINVLLGVYKNWTTKDYIGCVGTGFDN